MNERDARLQIIDVGRRMYDRGYIAGTDGNLSVRLPDGNILATPSGVAKGFLETSDLLVTDPDGHVIAGSGRPSSELQVHLAAYRVRDEINAVVHAHPKAAVAHSLAGIPLDKTIIPETVFTLGTIAATEYDTPGSQTLAERMEQALRCHDAIVMERHGTVTLGTDLVQAYLRLESLEHTAQILYMARTLGTVEPLPDSEVEHLFGLAEQSGLSWRFRTDPSCADGACTTPQGSAPDRDALVEALAQKVLDRLRR